MHKVLFSLKASEEYVDIKDYIAKDNLFYAYDVLVKIDASIDTISQFPFIGKIASGDIRIIVEPQYRFKIVYQIRKDTIFILSIFKYKNSWE